LEIGFASLVGVEPLPFPELLRRSGALGLDAVEVNVGPAFRRIGDATYPGHLDLDAVVREGPGAVQEALAAHGMRIAALAPMLNLLTSDPEVRAARIGSFRQVLDACAVLGVGTVVTYGGSPHGMWFWGLPGVRDGHPSNRLGDSIEAFREVFGPLAGHAEDRGVRIALETAPRGGGEGNVAHAPELWDLLFDAVPSPALGLSLDPSHLVWLQIPDVPGVIRRYAARVYHLDAKDTEILPWRLARQGVLGNSWWRYRLPGLGTLDWGAIILALREAGYDDVLTIENEDPEYPGLEGVGRAARFLRRQLDTAIPATLPGEGRNGGEADT
jgi:sugar phosphate isomerase/epimerase